MVISDPVTSLLGYQIAKAREATHMSRAQLARRLGVPTERVVRWEEGLAKPSGARLEKLCTLLGADFGYRYLLAAERREGPSLGARAHGNHRVHRQFIRLNQHLHGRTMW